MLQMSFALVEMMTLGCSVFSKNDLRILIGYGLKNEASI